MVGKERPRLGSKADNKGESGKFFSPGSSKGRMVAVPFGEVDGGGGGGGEGEGPHSSNMAPRAPEKRRSSKPAPLVKRYTNPEAPHHDFVAEVILAPPDDDGSDDDESSHEPLEHPEEREIEVPPPKEAVGKAIEGANKEKDKEGKEKGGEEKEEGEGGKPEQGKEEEEEEEEGELILAPEPHAAKRPNPKRPALHVDLKGARLGEPLPQPNPNPKSEGEEGGEGEEEGVNANPSEGKAGEPLPLTEANVRGLESSRRASLTGRFRRSTSRGSGDGTPRGLRPSLSNFMKRTRSNPALRKHMASLFKDTNTDAGAFKLEDLEKKLGVKVMKDPHNQHRNLQKAACYLVDAFHGRLKNGLGSNFDEPFHIRTAFRVHMKPGFKTSLKFEAILLCLLVFWEPASFKRADETSATQTLVCKVIELIVLLFLFSDYLLRLVYMGMEKINEKYFIRMLMWVEIVCLVDVLISFGLGRNAVRFSRPLRPVVFALVDKNTLNLCTQCMSAERKLRPLAVLLLFTVCVCSVLVTALCAESVWDEPQELSQGWTDYSWRPYQSFLYTFTPLTSLVSVEGFPDQVLHFAEATPELTLVFYGLIILGTYTLLNLAIAIQVDEFQRLSKKTTTNEEKKLMKTLTVVFYLARNEETLKLSFEDFKVLMLCYKSRMKISLINMLFQGVDKDMSGDLDLGEFLDLCDLLRSSEFTNRKNFEVGGLSHLMSTTRRSISRQIVRLGSRKSVLSSGGKKTLAAIVDHRNFVMFSNALILANLILLATLNDGDSESALYTQIVLYLDFFFIFLFVGEFALLVYVLQWDVLKKQGWNRFHLVACCGTVLVFALYPALEIYLDERMHIQSTGIAIHKIASSLRAFRALKGNKHFSLYINLIKRIVPILRDFAKALFCFMYFHGIVCLELLYKTESYRNAKNMVLTELALLQTDGWQTLLYTLWGEVSTVEKFVASVLIYCFIWYICIIVLSQLMATLYDVFKVYRDNLNDKTQKKKASKSNWRRDMADKDFSKKLKDGMIAQVEGKAELEDDNKPDLERKASRESKVSQASQGSRHSRASSKKDVA